MAPSKKNDSAIDSDTEFDIYDIDSDDCQDDDKDLPPTTEDAFNNIFRGGTILPTRIRKKPLPYGSTPTPPPPPSKNTKKKKKKNTKKQSAPLVNSTRNNQSSNSDNNNKTKMKKRNRKSSNASIAPAPLPLSSVAPLSSIATNVQPTQQCMPSGAPILQDDELLSLSGPNGALLS